MDETLLFPSPNWFLVSNIAVSNNGWIIYGGPSKSICVLEPYNHEDGVISGNHSYRAHVAPRAHGERIVSVDISPEFLEKKNFLSGSADGSVKQWTLVNVHNTYKIKSIHSHDVHYNEKEEVAGVGYSTATIAITVGSFGNIVKWDLTSNVCQTYTKFLPSFKATCMSCSPHIPLHVAIGTKQGVIFVLDLKDKGKILYKVRGQDDEITNLSWCPQYELLVNKVLQVSDKRSTATARMEAIRNAPENEDVPQLSGIKQNLLKATTRTDAIENEPEKAGVLEQSGLIKNLPEDSFDESVVEEDDMFDIYTDHAPDEFGHKKYEPEDILVKIKSEKADDSDYLAECLKLKQEILKRKNQEEPSIESLVEAMDKTHVDITNNESCSEPKPSGSKTKCVKREEKKHVEASVHIHKHLLATIGRFGGVRIWSKAGKLVASCAVAFNSKTPRNKSISWPTVLWYRPDTLLLVDGKSQLLECNPLQIDCKNKLEWRVVHALHKRGLYAIVTDAPRVQTAFDSPESPDFKESHKWSIYTASQDRNIIKYSMTNKKQLAIYNTCGGFLYNVQFCPYDAGKVAISVGDGAVRVWRSATLPDDDTKLYPGKVQTYWQNVQGKVLTAVWHPTKENLLAFGTGESRVGLLDISGKGEKPARVLYPALNGGVYSLCWGAGAQLLAVGGAALVVYDTRAPDDAPKEVNIVVDGQKWGIGSVTWNSRGTLCGSITGALAVLDPTTNELWAVAFLFSKMIHMAEWHPLQTSNSSEESPYKNLIAVCSLDRNSNIIIVEYKDKKDGGKELVTWKTLSGHKLPVLQVAWNPHREELLLSTSQDTTVRVWDVTAGTCVSIFGNHSQHSLGAAWSALPQRERAVLSGGGDCCLRLWDYAHHAPDTYERVKHETSTKNKRSEKKEKCQEETENDITEEQQVAAQIDVVRKPSKRYILPIMHRQMNPCPHAAVKKMISKYVVKESEEETEPVHYVDFLKIFGSINEINEVLDMEAENLRKEDNIEGWITLAIFRGHIDSMIQIASQRDMLCPYLLSMAPCVSFKYWKDTTQLYIAQINRLIAKGAEGKLCENRHYGGAIYKKMAALLSIHDIKGAVAALSEGKLFKEAYILCRLRYMDSIAQETLREWAKDSYHVGNLRLAVICHIALGDLSDAATVLAKFCDQESLSLAADLAKMSGRATFADHVEKKAQTTTFCPKKKPSEELLGDLPSRIEMLMKDLKEKDQNLDEEAQSGDDKNIQNGDEENIQNGDKTVHNDDGVVQVDEDGDKY